MKTYLIAILLLLSCLPMAHARTVDIPTEKISLTIPDDWISADKPGMLMTAANTGNDSAVEMLAQPNDENQMMDSDFIKGMKEGMIGRVKKDGGNMEITAENPVNINGVPAYFLQAKDVLSNAQTVYSYTYAVAANKKLYLISIQTLDANQGPQLQSIATSLRFASPPVLPDVSDSRAGKLGELIGYALALVVVLSLARRIFKRKSPQS